MIIAQSDTEVLRSGDFKEHVFKLAQTSHIFKILRDGIYSDKPLAVVREYWANAHDEHVKMGKPDLPVDITLPTYMQPYFKIRDYGKGLSPKEVRDIFITYGESTKTQSDDYIGALGIGCKSAFSYTKTFQVTSFFEGKAHVYSCYIDESEMGKIAEISSNKSSLPNGVEVSIPVNTYEFPLFATKVKQLFKYAKHRPNIKGDSNFKFDEPAYKFQGQGWGILNDYHTSICLMGDIPYNFAANTFVAAYEAVIAALRKEEKTNQEVLVEEGKLTRIDVDSVIKYPVSIPHNIKKLVETGGLILEFKIGELEIAASREALSYKSKTVLAIYNKVLGLLNAIKSKFETELTACKTLWEAKLLWCKYAADSNINYLITDDSLRSMKWNNMYISDNLIKWQHVRIYPPKPVTPVATATPALSGAVVAPAPIFTATPAAVMINPISCIHYHRDRKQRLEKSETYNISAQYPKHTPVIINDLGTIRGVYTSMKLLLPPDGSENSCGGRYMFTCTDDANKQALVKFFTESGIPFAYLSTIEIPKAEKSEYKPSPKYQKKIFVFNRFLDGKNSDAWDIADVDPEDEEGIYVVIDRYQPKFNNNDATIEQLATIVNFIEKQEGKPLVVYGVKEASEVLVKDSWTKLENYCIELCTKTLNATNYNQLVADFNHFKQLKDTTIYKLFSELYKPCATFLDKDSVFASIADSIIVVQQNHDIYMKHEGIVAVQEILGVTPNSIEVKPTFNISDALTNKWLNHYPMLDYALNKYVYAYDHGSRGIILYKAHDYIKLVETSKKLQLSS